MLCAILSCRFDVIILLPTRTPDEYTKEIAIDHGWHALCGPYHEDIEEHQGEGWCGGGINDQIASVSTALECWSACASKHPSTLVAIDWWADDGGECYCQDACECMEEIGDDDVTLIVKEGMDPPDECSFSYNYSYDDCSAGFAKLYCENGVLYSGHCGDSCSNDCQVDDITSLYDGKYYCDPSDPSFYFYDEDGDRDPEGTWYLPISDENGCYYNSCEDDDDEDDDDDLDWSCAEDCDSQCLSDKTCLSDCDKPLLERVCDMCYVSSAVFFSLCISRPFAHR